jgi:hypothetical protein
MQPIRLVLAVCAVLVAFVAAAGTVSAAPAPAPRYSAEVDTARFSDDVLAAITYVAAVERDEVGRYLVAVAAEEAEDAARAAAARADAQRQADAHTATQSVSGPVSAPSPDSRSFANGSGACGGATNGADQFIGRETRGSADPVNQDNLSGSGAHGCYQITPSTWAASCGDLGGLAGSSAGTQARCASRLPLSAWAGG